MTWHNWAGLESAEPREELSATSVAEVCDAVRRAAAAGGTVKMPGTGHSFTGIAVAEGTQLDPAGLDGLMRVDRDRMEVTVRPGTPLKTLNSTLAGLGLSLHNMGDIAEQTVAGATSTGTHGTGGVAASLSMQLTALELVTGDGTVLRASREENADVFAAARIGLGALGILTSLTFRVEPLFTLEAHESPMRLEQVIAEYDALTHDHEHFEFYWFPHTDLCLTKRNNRTTEPARPLGPVRAYVEDELLSNGAFELLNRVAHRRPSWTPRLNTVAASALSERRFSDIPHRVFTARRTVRFREMEYAVPREVGMQALGEARDLIERRGWRISFPVEVRSAPADDITLSTASGRDVVYLAFHVFHRADHSDYFGEIEKLMLGYGGRPHWGKLHTLGASDFADLYPGFEDFLALRDRLDPRRVFGNGYLRRVLGA